MCHYYRPLENWANLGVAQEQQKKGIFFKPNTYLMVFAKQFFSGITVRHVLDDVNIDKKSSVLHKVTN